MTDYKFLHTRDIDRVLIDETVRISSLAHFRQMEQEQWPRGHKPGPDRPLAIQCR
jgi:hypothetical protein